MDIYSKYNISIPKRKITELDVDDQIKVLTFRTGKIVPRVLKDLDEYLKKFGGRKVSLLYKGKKDKRENYKMREYVSEYGEYFDEIEDGILIFAVGNICGHGKKLVDYLENKGEIMDG